MTLEPLEDRRLLAAIYGQKWHDVDADAHKDPGEEGLSGWTIELRDTAGNLIAKTITVDRDLDEDGSIDPVTETGHYSFTGLADGTYVLNEVLKEGWVQSTPDPVVTLASELDDDLQLYKIDCGFESLMGSGEKWVRSADDGQWFYILPNGEFYEWDNVSGFRYRTKLEGTLIAVLDPVYHTNLELLYEGPGTTAHVTTVDEEAEAHDVDFGNFRPAVIRGQTWHDLNADGTWDVDEPALNGWTIELLDESGQVLATTTTADRDRNGDDQIDPVTEAGWYGFDGLRPGSYTTRQVALEDWHQSSPASSVHTFSFVSGDQATDANFANYQGASLHGRKWHDRNANGIWDDDEPTLNGWTIELLDENGQVVATTATADVDLNDDGQIDPSTESGWYRFDDLEPGPYAIREVVEEGWVQSAPGLSDHAVTIQSGDAIDDRDFGNYQSASITGRKWHDLNGNGSWDANEPALNGWIIELLDENEQVVDVATTADMDLNGDDQIDPVTETGWYRFDGLGPGSFTVREVAPDGWLQSAPAQTVYTVRLGTVTHTLEAGAYTVADSFMDGRVGEGTHYHASNVLPIDPIDSTVFAADMAEVGGLFGDEEIRGVAEFDITGMPVALSGTVAFRVADISGDLSDFPVGGLQGQEKYLGEIDVIAYLGNVTEDLEDFQAEPLGVIGTFHTADVRVNDTLTFDVTDIYNERIAGEDSSLGIRLQIRDATVIPDEAITFHGFALELEESAEIVSQVDINFGNYQTASIAGRTWHDVDGDRVWGTEEEATNGWTIELVDDSGSVVATATSADLDLDADGRIDPATESGWYRFPDVTPGQYRVRQVAQDGWILTSPVNQNYEVTAVSGQSIEGLNFGNTELTVHIFEVEPNPRAEPVEQIQIQFSHGVAGFDLDDLRLFRLNDTTVEVLIAPASLIAVDEANWIVDSLEDLTAVAGIYFLVLDASESGITEVQSGIALTTGDTVEWVNGPGDVDLNGLFNQLDIVQILQLDRYLQGPPATWSQGDWNNNHEFDPEDLQSVIRLDHYLQGLFGAPASSVETQAVDAAFAQPADSEPG